MRRTAHSAPTGPAKVPGFDIKGDGRRIDLILANYREDRRQFVEKTKRQLPGRAEIQKIHWARAQARKNAF
jgi:hypothetical protein